MLRRMNVGGGPTGGRVLRLPFHVRDLVLRPEIRLRIAMALEAPSHSERRLGAHDLHLVDAPVTRDAADAGREVRAVIEVGVARKLVDLHPLDRLAALPAGADRREARAVGLHHRVAAMQTCVGGTIALAATSTLAWQ